MTRWFIPLAAAMLSAWLAISTPFAYGGGAGMVVFVLSFTIWGVEFLDWLEEEE